MAPMNGADRSLDRSRMLDEPSVRGSLQAARVGHRFTHTQVRPNMCHSSAAQHVSFPTGLGVVAGARSSDSYQLSGPRR